VSDSIPGGWVGAREDDGRGGAVYLEEGLERGEMMGGEGQYTWR